MSRNIAVSDVVTEIGDGILLINLIEVLTEKTFPGKYDLKPKMRVQKIDNLSRGLAFLWDCGVQMKVKPSAEDLADGDEKRILGMIWAIMLTFMKFGDAEGTLNKKTTFRANYLICLKIVHRITECQGCIAHVGPE